MYGSQSVRHIKLNAPSRRAAQYFSQALRPTYPGPQQLAIESEALKAASFEGNPHRAVIARNKCSKVMLLFAFIHSRYIFLQHGFAGC